MDKDSIRDTWIAGLPDEVYFWAKWIRGLDTTWEEERQARLAHDMPLQDWVRELAPTLPGSIVRILDVGAGPLTLVGKVWPERTVLITATDPLANDYNTLLDAEGIEPPVRTIAVHGEQLDRHFEPGTFDCAIAINCLDHSYDPLRIIQNMVTGVKPGGAVRLQHYVNEGETEAYEGLHQWNFSLHEGQFIIVNQQDQIVVETCLRGIASLEAQIYKGEKDLLVVTIRTSYDRASERNNDFESSGSEGFLEQNLTTLTAGESSEGDDLWRQQQDSVIGRQRAEIVQLRLTIADLQRWIQQQAEALAWHEQQRTQLEAQLTELRNWAEQQAEAIARHKQEQS